MGPPEILPYKETQGQNHYRFLGQWGSWVHACLSVCVCVCVADARTHTHIHTHIPLLCAEILAPLLSGKDWRLDLEERVSCQEGV